MLWSTIYDNHYKYCARWDNYDTWEVHRECMGNKSFRLTELERIMINPFGQEVDTVNSYKLFV